MVLVSELVLYVYVYENYRIASFPWDSPWTWLVCFIFVDWTYYWFHRAAHGLSFLCSVYVILFLFFHGEWDALSIPCKHSCIILPFAFRCIPLFKSRNKLCFSYFCLYVFRGVATGGLWGMSDPPTVGDLVGRF